MFRTKKVKAEIIETISCTRHESVFRDYYAEDLADRYSPYRYPRERWSSGYNFNNWEHEDNMEEYSRLHLDYQTRRNEWTGEMELYRKHVWYEIELKIRYVVSKITYEKQINIESVTENIKEIKVLYDKANPENILDIACR